MSLNVSESADPSLPPKEPILEEARADFAQFYRTATADDAATMDKLVLAEAAISESAGPEAEAVFSKPNGGVEEVRSAIASPNQELRDQVRATKTFRALTATEQGEIERLLCGGI